MAREYAIRAANSPDLSYQTPGFQADEVTESLPLPDGSSLLLCGEAKLQQENRRLRELLEEAESANRAKESFLSNMSHDIRTPMNAIVGMTALAQKHIDEKKRVIDALNKIELASGHLLSLINDVLDMSRISSGRMQIARERFSLADLIHQILIICQPLAQQHRHSFSFDCEEICAEELYGDPLRLRQIFVNIINNAVKYTKDGGRIRVSVRQAMEGERCRLLFTCADNGIGMSQDFLERIFQPFERVSSSTISGIEGTGLGMSIVKKLIDAMGGTIQIESEAGKGTTVGIGIPLGVEPLPVQTEALRDKRLLVLEADERLQNTYRQFLGEAGLDYTLAATSAQAIAALTDADFTQQAYDAMILGSKLEHTGSLFELASYLNKAFPQLALILVSDQDWSEIEFWANRCGIRHFIPLPLFRKTLLNGLNLALQGSGDGAGDSGSPDLSGKRILLAEDNMINREIALELLSVTNARVDTAQDGQQAVDAYLASPEGSYDLVLMDIQMPVMDGYEATRRIRSSGRSDSRTLKIFAMTANSFAEDIARAREAGMDGHLAKPIDINMLMQVLRQIR